jgi:hypothetical protein
LDRTHGDVTTRDPAHPEAAGPRVASDFSVADLIARRQADQHHLYAGHVNPLSQ